MEEAIGRSGRTSEHCGPAVWALRVTRDHGVGLNGPCDKRSGAKGVTLARAQSRESTQAGQRTAATAPVHFEFSARRPSGDGPTRRHSSQRPGRRTLTNDIFFTPEGGEAYLRDLPDAELVRLDSGHSCGTPKFGSLLD